jgi:hypothetical protein
MAAFRLPSFSHARPVMAGTGRKEGDSEMTITTIARFP